MSNELTLITGAASGIGRELARQFAANGHPLILTARSETDLNQLSEDLIAEHGVQVRFIAADLNESEGLQSLLEAVAEEQIDILVNNAGLGQHGKFAEIPIEREIEIINVNITAALVLTRFLLPEMIARGAGRILNTASIAGFMPAPQLAVYHASKAFVLSFTEALATELHETGVTATALCPGATDTDFFPEADLTHSTIFQKGNVMAPQAVAEIGYKAVMRGERVVVAGGMNKAMAFSQRFLPEWLSSKLSDTFYSDVKPGTEKRVSGEIAAQHAARS
jgi:short-subunit dehydrogenase